MKKIQVIFILLFCIGLNHANSQDEGINCVLLDNEKPISNANIKAVNHSYRSISSEFGVFSIPLSILPIELEISHIGYHAKKIIITDSLVNKHYGLLKISIEKEIHVFDEVEILDKKTKLLSKRDGRWSLLDYCIANGYVQVLYMKDSKRKIKFISLINNASFVKLIDIKANKLIADKLGNTFLMNREKAVQFTILQNDSIYFYPEIHTSDYIKNIEPIIGKANESLIYNTLSSHNQKISFWAARLDKRYLLHEIYNLNRFSFAQGVIDEHQQLVGNYGLIKGMGNLSDGDLKVARRLKLLSYTYSMIGTIPEYSPAYLKQDTVFIFDHVNSFIFCFDEYGNMLDSVSIGYHQSKEWEKEVLYDQKRELFYAKLMRKGKLSLYLINTKSRDIRFASDIEGTVFPEKLTIYDDVLYYMSFDVYHQRVLIQQKICNDN